MVKPSLPILISLIAARIRLLWIVYPGYLGSTTLEITHLRHLVSAKLYKKILLLDYYLEKNTSQNSLPNLLNYRRFWNVW